MGSPRNHRLLAFATWVAALAGTLVANADDSKQGPPPPETDNPSALHITKSENRNQVHYAPNLDDQCKPKGAAPMYAYWRNLEEGPDARSPLLKHEQRAYGIGKQAVETDDKGKTTIRFRLRAFPKREFVVNVIQRRGKCYARATTTIAGEEAIVTNVFVKLTVFGVKYAQLNGRGAKSNKPITEKISPQ